MTPEQATAALAADPDALTRARAELNSVRARRIAAQKSLQGAGTAATALTSAARDRDAGTSSQLETERARVEQMCEQLLEMCRKTDADHDRLRRLFQRDVMPRQHPLVLRLQQLMDAELPVRAAAQKILDSARVPLELPVPPQLQVKEEVDPELAQMLDEMEAESARRAAQAVKRHVDGVPGTDRSRRRTRG